MKRPDPDGGARGRTKEDSVARDEFVEEAIDRASEEARNTPAPRQDTAEDVAARKAARTQRAFERGRELQAPNMVPGGEDEEE